MAFHYDDQIDGLNTPTEKKYLKRKVAKKMRRAAKKLAEDAPKKFLGVGYKKAN
jgi:hypothetical protein